MTNLEFYKDEIEHRQETIPFLCAICLTRKKESHCNGSKFSNCPKNAELLDWLCEEHKEPIKLKQWEYDLLKYYEGQEFSNYGMLNYLKNKGNFKCITDTNMLITDILDNCEIVADDYSDFDKECK